MINKGEHPRTGIVYGVVFIGHRSRQCEPVDRPWTVRCDLVLERPTEAERGNLWVTKLL